MIKIFFTSLVSGIALTFAAAQDLPPHRDMNTLKINAQTDRQELFFYPTEEAAVKGLEDGPALTLSPNYINLNGTWDFAYFTDGEKIPEDFAGIEWKKIAVPGNWEVQGFGYPIYVNQPYEFCPVKPKPPILPDKIEAGVYKRTIWVPSEWNGSNIYLNLAASSAGTYVYLNGEFVGYHEDSKAAVRYNIGKTLKEGNNELIIKIFRWSTGSYLECQDFWRMSGIERDVYLSRESVPANFDINVVSTLDEDLSTGQFKLDIKGAPDKAVSYKLLDGDKTVLEGNYTPGETVHESLPQAKPWSAETPNLYTLVVKAGDDYTAVDVGFRRFEITKIKQGDKEYPVFLVNGQPVKFKGVNLHEHNPLTGHYTNKELILKDLLLMKSVNINAIRTCHYPQPREFYELCDRLGFYVYDEANIESHGVRYKLEETLANKLAWGPMHEDRVMNMYTRTAGYPCVTILSLGNEAGNGINFYDCYRLLKEKEKNGMNRPVCYERAEREWNTDMLVPQYPGADWFKKMGETIPDRPIAPSEYAHAMGNSTGSLDFQWEYIYKYPNLQGGFIWDWVDQGLEATDSLGRKFFAYGGDYGKNLPSDGNFLCNGIVNPDRNPHPACAEVAWNYQNVKVEASDPENGLFDIINRFYFTSLKGFKLEWCIEADGLRKTGGSIALKAGPQETESIAIKLPALKTQNDWQIKFYVKNPAGEQIAYDAVELAKAVRPAYKYDIRSTKASQDSSLVVLENAKARIVFNKKKHLLTSYSFEGKELIDTCFGLRPNFWRAPTDNDYGNEWPKRCQRWKRASKKFQGDVEVIEIYHNPVLKVVYQLPGDASFTVVYRLDSRGVLGISADYEGSARLNKDKRIELPRLGFRARIKGISGNFQYYGRGPEENYSDRFSGTLKGIYNSSASESYYPYVRPQETGHHIGCEWLKVDGAFYAASDDFEFNILNCRVEDLDSENAKGDYMWQNRDPKEKHDRREARNVLRKYHHISDVPIREYVEVCLDYKMTGVGGYNSWGSRTEPSRTLWSDKDYSFSMAIIPEGSSAVASVKTSKF